jgi:hypothetical protein
MALSVFVICHTFDGGVITHWNSAVLRLGVMTDQIAGASDLHVLVFNPTRRPGPNQITLVRDVDEK